MGVVRERGSWRKRGGEREREILVGGISIEKFDSSLRIFSYLWDQEKNWQEYEEVSKSRDR